MKKILFLLLMLYGYGMHAQERTYYIKGEKKSFESDYTFLTVWTNNLDTPAIKEIVQNKYAIAKVRYSNMYNAIIPYSDAKDAGLYRISLHSESIEPKEGERLMNRLRENGNIVYVTNSLKNNRQQTIAVSNEVLVKLESDLLLPDLKALAEQIGITILGQNEYMPSWYILACNKHTGDPLSVATALYQSGKFEYATPNLIGAIQNQVCASDPFFTDQWGLRNSGASGGIAGTDINVCPAWDITTGSPDIITAVIDEGIEMTHPDLAGNIYGSGWDEPTNSAPSVVHGPHGTSCAGIIGAEKNTIGVSGVAPGSGLMSISVLYGAGGTGALGFANAINKAAEDGASVLSNSWSSLFEVPVIDDAIANVMSTGRNGLGCVVVFSSGNGNSAAGEYPSKNNSNILVVGGIDRCGFRAGNANYLNSYCEAWTLSAPGSSYGDPLDIVAPGNKVYTTDLAGSAGYDPASYTPDFAGTSAACPFVAGVAALILSVNPCLTRKQVHDIICRSAKKVNTVTYTYGSSSGHQLGTWNQQVGYGLVDAEQAVRVAMTTYLQNKTETASQNYFNDYIMAGYEVTPFYPVGNYVVSPGADITIRAEETIMLENGFDATEGSEVNAYIETGNPGCEGRSFSFISHKLNAPLVPPATGNDGLEAMDENAIKVYPNPLSDQLVLDYKLGKAAAVIVTIANMYGQVVYRSQGNEISGAHRKEIKDVARFAPGLYVVNICFDKKCKTFKIAKGN